MTIRFAVFHTGLPRQLQLPSILREDTNSELHTGDQQVARQHRTVFD